MRNIKVWVIVVLFLTAFACYVPVWFYRDVFSGGLATDKESFEAFGSFIGGSLSPILGLANLILLVMVAFYVARVEDRRQLNAFRFDAYKELAEILNKHSLNHSEQVEIIESNVRTFDTNNRFLFTEREREYLTLLGEFNTSLDLLVKQLEEDEENQQVLVDNIPIPLKRVDMEDLRRNWPRTVTPTSRAIDRVEVCRDNLLNFMRRIMIQ